MEPAFTGIKNIGYIKTTLNHAAMSIIKDDNNGYRRIPLAPNSRVEEGYLLICSLRMTTTASITQSLQTH